ncbi:MAG: hypothetical protein ABC596_09415, partial [Candidatus Methanosuratincola petrocarbonis]
MNLGRNSNGPIYYVGLLTVLVITFAFAIAAYNYLAPGLGLSSVQIGTQPDQQPGLVSVTKPLTISVRDAQAGTPLSGATVSLLDQTPKQLEALPTQATGTATTAVPYASGTQLYIGKAASGYVTEYSQVTVPQMSRVDAESLSSNLIAQTMTKKPSLVITVTDRNGNVISNGGSFNMSGLTSAQFTVTIVNTLDNSGWKTSYDPVNKVQLGLASVVVPSDKVVVTGTGTLVNRDAVSHLITPIPDASITKTVIGSQVSGGSCSFTFSVNRGTLQAGQTATV